MNAGPKATAEGTAHSDLAGEREGHPERLDRGEHAGTLIEAEHLGRYRWAAAAAPGARVLDAGCGTAYGTAILAAAGASEVVGVDRDRDVLDAVREGMPEAVRLEAADVLDLPFEADSFDLVVCFEVLEHLDEPEAGLDELARVLAGGGLLAVSSPNRRVFPPGNPHHVREYVPEELHDSLGRRFANVRLARQHTWASSAIFDDETQASGDGEPIEAVTAKSGSLEPGDEVFTVAIASDAELPALGDLVAVGPPLELGDLAEARQLREMIEHQEQRIRELEEVRGRLVDAEQKLAVLPGLEADRRVLEEMRESLSWRVTAPLRRGKAEARRTVPPARRGAKRLLATLIARLRGGP